MHPKDKPPILRRKIFLPKTIDYFYTDSQRVSSANLSDFSCTKSFKNELIDKEICLKNKQIYRETIFPKQDLENRVETYFDENQNKKRQVIYENGKKVKDISF